MVTSTSVYVVGAIAAVVFFGGVIKDRLAHPQPPAADTEQFAAARERARTEAQRHSDAAEKEKREREITAGKGPPRERGIGCAVRSDTSQYFCFDRAKVRSNGNLRSFSLLTGGQKHIASSGYTAVIHCEAGVMELRDFRGVVFARDSMDALHTIDLRDQVCGTSARPDPKLN